MRLIEWEVAEDGYEEQIVIPHEKKAGWPAMGPGLKTKLRRQYR